MNSRHPDPRRVLGRCRAAVRGPDPLDPGDPGMNSFLCVLGVNRSTMEPGDAPVDNPLSTLSMSTSKTPRKVTGCSNTRATLSVNCEGQCQKRLAKLKVARTPVQPFR